MSSILALISSRFSSPLAASSCSSSAMRCLIGPEPLGQRGLQLGQPFLQLCHLELGGFLGAQQVRAFGQETAHQLLAQPPRELRQQPGPHHRRRLRRHAAPPTGPVPATPRLHPRQPADLSSRTGRSVGTGSNQWRRRARARCQNAREEISATSSSPASSHRFCVLKWSDLNSARAACSRSCRSAVSARAAPPETAPSDRPSRCGP